LTEDLFIELNLSKNNSKIFNK